MLARIAGVFGKHQVSLASVIQKEPDSNDTAHLVFITHKSREKAFGAAIEEIERPRGFSVSLKGQAEEQEKSNRALVLALLVSLVIVYMVMAAQFRSLMHPLIIMVTVPLGLIGVFTALYITNTSFSWTSMMGIIMMVGIVVANGILLVSYANDERARGKRPEEAALNAFRFASARDMATACSNATPS